MEFSTYNCSDFPGGLHTQLARTGLLDLFAVCTIQQSDVTGGKCHADHSVVLGQELNLQWEWEQQMPELETSVFMLPGNAVKNGDDRLVVLNDIALSAVNDLRGKHDTHVFTFRKKPIDHMSNSGWRRAREKAGLPQVRVHDLKHTFGRRLRSAGVSFEDRQDAGAPLRKNDHAQFGG